MSKSVLCPDRSDEHEDKEREEQKRQERLVALGACGAVGEPVDRGGIGLQVVTAFGLLLSTPV
jgi:hypothetical protein